MQKQRLGWTTIGRRAVLRAGAIGAAGLAASALVSCSDDDGPSQTTEDDQPVLGGTLRIGTLNDPTSLEPHAIIAQHVENLWNIYDGRTRYDHQLQPQGALVKSWEQTDGGTKLTLHLRDGVTFHSGREFTSADVKANLERLKDPALPQGVFRTMSQWFPSLETPDKSTVIMKADKSRPAVFDFLEQLNIADTQTLAGPTGKTTAVGTGPWKFVEWKQGVSFKVVKNPTYWDTGKPYMDGITWSTALQADTMVTQLEAGAQDVVLNPPVTSFIRLRGNSGFQTALHPDTGAYYIFGFSTRVTPFNDKRVRQAFNWAVDRKRFTTSILNNIVEPKSLPWPKASSAYEEKKDQTYSFDLKKAADLLKAAGVSDIKTSVYIFPGRPELIDLMPIWQNDLKSLGVDMQIRVVELAAFIDVVANVKYESVYAAGSTQAGLGSPGSMFSILPNVWGGDGKNNAGFENARWVELVEQGSTEIDKDKQTRIWSELNDMILDSSHVGVPAGQPYRIAYKKSLKGVTHHMHENFEYNKAWLT